MKKQQRSVDYDGLDGILQLPDATNDTAKGYPPFWLTALIAAGLIGAFLLYIQTQPAQPKSISVQTDSSVPSLASTHNPTWEGNNPASTNPEQEAASRQTDSAIDHHNSAAATENTPAQQAVDLEPAAAPPENEVPAATSPAILFTVHFKFDSSTLSLLDKSAKDDLIHTAKSCSNTIKLTGHTCNMGSAAVNKRIGLARANSVKKILSAAGIPAEMIAIASEGMDSPAVPNDTPIMAAQNRRVELTCRDH
ncbi:MAG: OmpA family protein [Methylomonas sp.]|jgi:outer membrane protein OmpA-like peptidoglycan-associated protein|uniref:OmpA family protein n=1 Tax=Methylomonas sp. TaxID=418 RepID=UPI0025F35F94|nr:OmpA family protein [Methylomonas sp.]MCK9606720.1 OmpA family protein [Methylomonas sp.]